MRAEYASLDKRVVGLERQLEEARTNGTPAEVHRLTSLYAEARERLAHARGMPSLREAAVALHYEQGEGWLGLDSCEDALDRLLFSDGSDGVHALEVFEASPSRVTLVGRIWWVLDRDCGDLIEATFSFDHDSHALTGIVVRAGEDISRDPYERLSARQQAKHIANRPENDEQWAVVIRAPTS